MQEYINWTFSKNVAGAGSVSHEIFERGEGNPVLLIQELPGISEPTLNLAEKLVQQGYKVIIPRLFGTFGKHQLAGNTARVFCMSKEFQLFNRDRSSYITNWLRELCKDLCDKNGVSGVAVIGMCLTGNFAIALMGDKYVLAAIASQPSLPLFNQHSLHLSPEEIDATRKRIDELGRPMMALRFEHDKFVRKEKFQCIHDNFNADGKERVRLKTLPGKGHSVLTYDFVDKEGHPTYEALREVLTYLKEAFEN